MGQSDTGSDTQMASSNTHTSCTGPGWVAARVRHDRNTGSTCGAHSSDMCRGVTSPLLLTSLHAFPPQQIHAHLCEQRPRARQRQALDVNLAALRARGRPRRLLCDLVCLQPAATEQQSLSHPSPVFLALPTCSAPPSMPPSRARPLASLRRGRWDGGCRRATPCSSSCRT